MADAAALLHREGGFLHAVEDRGQVILDPAHDEAVEERDLAAGAGASQDAAGRQKAEIGDGIEEALAPGRLHGPIAFNTGCGLGDAAKRGLKVIVAGRRAGTLARQRQP